MKRKASSSPEQCHSKCPFPFRLVASQSESPAPIHLKGKVNGGGGGEEPSWRGIPINPSRRSVQGRGGEGIVGGYKRWSMTLRVHATIQRSTRRWDCRSPCPRKQPGGRRRPALHS